MRSESFTQLYNMSPPLCKIDGLQLSCQTLYAFACAAGADTVLVFYFAHPSLNSKLRHVTGLHKWSHLSTLYMTFPDNDFYDDITVNFGIFPDL